MKRITDWLSEHLYTSTAIKKTAASIKERAASVVSRKMSTFATALNRSSIRYARCLSGVCIHPAPSPPCCSFWRSGAFLFPSCGHNTARNTDFCPWQANLRCLSLWQKRRTRWINWNNLPCPSSVRWLSGSRHHMSASHGGCGMYPPAMAMLSVAKR